MSHHLSLVAVAVAIVSCTRRPCANSAVLGVKWRHLIGCKIRMPVYARITHFIASMGRPRVIPEIVRWLWTWRQGVHRLPKRIRHAHNSTITHDIMCNRHCMNQCVNQHQRVLHSFVLHFLLKMTSRFATFNDSNRLFDSGKLGGVG